MLRTILLLTAALVVLPAVGRGQDVASERRRACDAGALLSCNLLGLLHETGAAGTRDVARAEELYRRVCDAGVAAGCVRLQLLRDVGSVSALGDGFVRVGRVAESGTGEPIGGALVSLPEAGVSVLSDEAGRVELGRLERGSHRIATQRPGYAGLVGELPVPWDGEFLILMDRVAEEEEPDLGRIFGRVTDETGLEGLADVEVTIVAGSRTERTLSGPRGRFSVAGLERGRAEVRFARLGYEPRETTVMIEPGRTVEVVAALSLQPVELEPISVSVGSGYLERSGFYRRARSAWGTQLTRQDLEVIEPEQVSDLLWRAPGVAAERGPRGTRVVSRRRWLRSDGSACVLRPYLDGVPMFDDWDVDQVRPQDIEGLEIYQRSGAPIEYRNLIDPDGTYPCGVVLVWTRRR